MSTSSVDRWPVDSQNKQYVPPLPQPNLSTTTTTTMRSSRIMDAFCKDAARAEWTPQPTKPQKLKKKHRFSLSKHSTFGQPIALPGDVIPVAHPRRLPRAPRLEEDYRRAQGKGPLSLPKAGTNNPPQPVPEPVFPPDQFAVNECTTASYRRRSWTLKPRNGAGPAKPALVTIAEFEDGNELKSGFVSCAASIAYTSPSVSRSTTYTLPSQGSKEHDTKAPLRSPPPPPPPPKTDPDVPPIPKLPDSPPAPATFNPQPSPDQPVPHSARRPQSTRIFRVNSRGTTAPKRISSKKSYPTKENIITLGPAARPKLIEIVPAAAARRRSRGIRNSAPPRLASPLALTGPYELPAVASPKAVELPAVVVGEASPTTPTLTFTAPTPTPSPAPEAIPAPTRKPPPPPVVVVAEEEKAVYKPYRAPTPEVVAVADEKPLPVIPPLKTGRPAWQKAAQNVVEKMEAVEKKKKKEEEVSKTVVIPEALRIGMASRSLEARLGNWEALEAGERY